jgi:ribosome biogenesis protein BRX1
MTKEMLIHTFGTPRHHPKSKPFYDHVFSFNQLDGKVFFRNYQIVNEKNDTFTSEDDVSKLSLIEIGPRFSLCPIKAFDGTMGGEALWQNSQYISPTKLRGKRYD